jgi:hypothetical protein
MNVSNSVFASRNIAKGEIIESAPLYAVSSDIVPENINCFSPSNPSGIFFCPLSFIAHVKGGSDCQNVVEECSSSATNAKLEWSQFNAANKLVGEISAEELLKVCKIEAL